MHSDGKVLIEGKGGIVIDSAQSKMELKGSEISMKTTSGVKIDGGTVGVDVTTQRPARRSRAPPRSSRARAPPRSRPSGMTTVQGSMVKIN